MKEIWKDVIGYEGLYVISNKGRVKNVKRKGKITEIIMKQRKNKKGYLSIMLTKKGVRKNHRISRLVAYSFLDISPEKEEVNHINGNKQDNNVCNLEWVTHKENIRHSTLNGLTPKGERCAKSKLKESEVVEIRELYKTGKETTRSISEKYVVSHATIWQIVSGKSWKHVR